MNTWLKIILSIVTTASFLFGGFVLLIIVAFSGAGRFYEILVPVCVGAVLIFLLANIFGWLKFKTRLIAFCTICVLILLSVTANVINKTYHDSFEKVNEQGVDLTLYEPFKPGTKAVSLDEPSSLKLSGDLPKIDGATALYPLYSAFAQATYPEGDYKVNMDKESDLVVCTNTVGSYQRLINGEADIIFAAAPSAEQLGYAEENGVELKLTPIGREAFVFFVNAKNPVSDLKSDDIQNIYSGSITNWSQLGGKDKSIRAFQRPENSGSQTTIIKIMGDVPLMTPPQEDVAEGMGGIIKSVSSYRNYDNAIGYSFLFFASEMVKDNKIKLLSINGTRPDRENVANGTYPYSSEFYAVTAGTQNENAQKLIDWILSDQGQYIIQKTGYTPIK